VRRRSKPSKTFERLWRTTLVIRLRKFKFLTVLTNLLVFLTLVYLLGVPTWSVSWRPELSETLACQVTCSRRRFCKSTPTTLSWRSERTRSRKTPRTRFGRSFLFQSACLRLIVLFFSIDCLWLECPALWDCSLDLWLHPWCPPLLKIKISNNKTVMIITKQRTSNS
jgi:hypothetical protein